MGKKEEMVDAEGISEVILVSYSIRDFLLICHLKESHILT